jgi:hypothetical protein
MRAVPIALGLLLLLPTPAPAQTAKSGAEITERLLLTPPDGWKTGGSTTSRGVVVNHLFPPGQTSETWTEMLSIQIMGKPLPSPREVAQKVVETSRAGCEATSPSQIAEGKLNNYPVATLTITCTRGRQTGKGGMIAMKAIQGGAAVYVIERLWRGEPFAPGAQAPVPHEVLQDWALFLRAVSVCDPADSTHPCSN